MLYKYTIYLAIKFIRWIKPSAIEERVEDGSLYLHNILLGSIISILTAKWFVYISNGAKSDRSTGKLTMLAIWAVFAFANYFLFFSNKKWKKIEEQFDNLNQNKKLILNILLVIILVLIIGIFFYK